MKQNFELRGLQVLNTRPLHQGKALTEAILAKGGQVIACPAIEIVGLNTDWLSTLPPLESFKQAIFTSPNAVDYFFSALTKPIPSTLTITAIGQGTALALQKAGIRVDFLPESSASESLINLANLQAVNAQCMLLVKGEGGRTLIEEKLRERGAKLTTIAVYKRIMPLDLSKCLAESWQEKGIDIILVTSQESMQNLFQLFPAEAKTWLRQTTWLVLSKRLADAAKKFGIKHCIISQPENIIETLCQFKKGFKMVKQNDEKEVSIKKRAGTAPSYLLALCFLLSLITIGLVIFIKFDTNRNTSKLQNALQQLKNTAFKQNESLQKTIAQEGLKIQGIGATLKNIATLEGNQNQRFLLARARFYLDLAKINAYWSSEKEATIALLKAADLSLVKSDNQDVIPIRQAITAEIDQVKTIATPDLIGILNQLNEAKTRVLSLPLKPDVKTKENSSEPSSRQNWRDNFKKSLFYLEKLVVVQKQDTTTIERLLTPLYKNILRENIGMQLNVATWAVLEKQPEIYSQALDAAVKGIQRIFDTNAEATKTLIEQLQQLQSISLSPAKPMIGKSLELIDQLIQAQEGKS